MPRGREMLDQHVDQNEQPPVGPLRQGLHDEIDARLVAIAVDDGRGQSV